MGELGYEHDRNQQYNISHSSRVENGRCFQGLGPFRTSLDVRIFQHPGGMG